VIRFAAFTATGAIELGVCAWLIRRAITRQRAADLLYGRSRGLHLRRTRHRVPGLPRDGSLTGEEEAAMAGIVRAFRRRR
jgi:hypothetical protein